MAGWVMDQIVLQCGRAHVSAETHDLPARMDQRIKALQCGRAHVSAETVANFSLAIDESYSLQCGRAHVSAETRILDA